MSCPNPNLPEWSDLLTELRALGIHLIYLDAAYTAYNKDEERGFPSLDYVVKFADNVQVVEKDELHVRMPKEVKINSANNTTKLLRIARSESSQLLQTEAIEKIIQMNNKYAEDVYNGVEETSATSLIGQSQSQNNPIENEQFRNFGLFMHSMLNGMQTQSVKLNKKIDLIFSKELFNEEYNKYIKDYPFQIEGLTNDELFNIALGVVRSISKMSDNTIILPNIPISSKSYGGSAITGLANLLLIDEKGEVSVINFKTERIKELANNKSVLIKSDSGISKTNANLAIIQMAEKRNKIKLIKGTDKTFTEIGQRSVFDTWYSEIKVLEELLKQNNISSSENKVICLMYQTKKGSKYETAKLVTFNNDDYYELALGMKNYTKIQLNSWYNNGRYKNVLQQVDDAVDTVFNGAKVKENSKSPLDAFEVLPTEDQSKIFVESLSNNVESQLSDISKQLKNLNQDNPADKVKMDILLENRQSLLSIRTIIEKNKINPSAIKNATHFFQAVESVEEVLENISKSATKAYQEYFLNRKDPKKSNKDQLNVINQSLSRCKSMVEIIGIMNNIVAESRLSPESNISKKLQDFNMTVARIENQAREMRMETSIDVLLTPGEKTFIKVNEEQRAALLPKIEHAKNEISKLEKGIINVKWYRQLSHQSLMFVSKTYKEKFEGEDLTSVRRIESLQEDIRKWEDILNGFTYSRDAMRKYIEGVSNKSSQVYIGSNSMFSSSALTGDYNPDTAVASIANSDIGISAPVMMMKNHEAVARYNIMHDLDLMELSKQTDQLKEEFGGIDNLNKQLGKWEIYYTFNPETNAIEQKEKHRIATPYSASYKNKLKEFEAEIRIAEQKIKELNTKYLSAVSTPNELVFKKELAEAKNNKNELIKTQIRWKLDNCNLPYAEEFYRLQLELPEDVRVQLQDLYMEIDAIQHSYDGNQESDLNEDDLDRLYEIGVLIKKLREDAKVINPRYAEILDRFDDFYDYDRNDKLFTKMETAAIAMYGSGSDELFNWYKKNQVTRPTEDWYKETSELYDQMSSLFESIPEVDELRLRKSQILKAHREHGTINPKYITDEEIEELDEIEAKIIEISEASKGHLDGEKSNLYAVIKNRLLVLETKVLSPKYEKLFKSNYDNLSNSLQTLNVAENEFDLLSKEDKSGEKGKQLLREIDFYSAQFEQKEREFEKWYNKLHVDKYKSILIDDNLELRRTPKPFNYQRVPAKGSESKYVETVPNPKYFTVRKLRLDNWYVDGIRLNLHEINELKALPSRHKLLIEAGRFESRKGIINPNFIKGVDGIPFPKQVYEISKGVYGIRGDINENIDEQYLKILNNPKLFSLYNQLTKVYLGSQQKIHGRKQGYDSPGIAASRAESFSKQGVKDALKESFDIWRDKAVLVNSQQDLSENSYGADNNDIRMKYTSQLERGIQSEDIIGSVLKYVTEAHMNMALQDVAPQIDSYIEQLKTLKKELQNADINDVKSKKDTTSFAKRIKELDHAITMVEYERRKFIYGQADAQTNIRFKKNMNRLFSYISFIRIGFDIANQTKNYVSGNVQSFIAAGGFDSNHYTRKNWLYAKRRVYGMGDDCFLKNYFKDWGRITDLSKETMMYRLFNPSQKDYMKYMEEVSRGRKGRMLDKILHPGDAGFFIQDKGDTEIAVTAMFAVLDHYKFKIIDHIDSLGNKVYKKDDDGNPLEIAGHEAYYLDKNGLLEIRKDVDYTQEDEHRLMHIINSEMRRTQGNYAKADQTKWEDTIFGKMTFFFRKFLVPQFLNRFGYMRSSWDGSEAAIGYWKVVFTACKYLGYGNTLKEFFVGTKLLNKLGYDGLTVMNIKDEAGNDKKVDLGEFYAKKITQARQDMVAMIALSLLTLATLSFIRHKDDDDEELTMLEGNVFRVIWGVKQEAHSMNPLSQGSGQDYIKNFTTGIPIAKELSAALKFSDHALSYAYVMTVNGGLEPVDDDSELYTNKWKDAFYNKKYGAYEKGDLKLSKDLVDFTGIKNFRDLINPNYRIDQLKGKQ